MHRTLKSIIRKTATVLGLGACLATAAGTVNAQTWMAAYGGTGVDFGRGVISLPNNEGIVATGKYFHMDDDAFVVKTDGCYAPVWMNRYDLGGNEEARKIRRTDDGGYIIVGTTRDVAHCGTVNDIFLLRLDAGGAVLWARTYGGNGNEVGYDVQVASDGFIVAGSTDSYGAGGDDGLLMKTDLSGGLIWASSYGSTEKDYYTACALSASGTILVTGASGSPLSAAALLIRYTSTGSVGIAYYTMPGANNVGWRVLECPNGDIVVAGTAQGIGYGVTTGKDVFAIRTDFSGSMIDRNIIGSTDTTSDDEGLDMVMTSHGHFLITGIMSNPTGGHGGSEMMTMLLNSNMSHITTEALGWTNTEEGWGIDYVDNPFGNPEYVNVGLTKSFGVGLSDLYMVRREIGDRAACTNFATAVPMTANNLYYAFSPLYLSEQQDLPFGCDAEATAWEAGTLTLICSDCVPGLRKSMPGETGSDLSGVVSYPNPVRQGATLTLRYAAPNGNATIVVSDMAGRVVLERSLSSSTGETALSTEGWAAGAYVIQVKTGAATATSRVMIGGK